MSSRASYLRATVFVLLVGAVTVFLLSCENPSGEHKGNAPPTTRLSNVPANDTIARYIHLGSIPEFTLYWVGDDPDGFVIAYRYRWIDTYHGTSTATPWTTVLNITTIGASPLDTLMFVRGTPSSLFRMYNFFATIDPTDAALVQRIQDSLATGRPFAVPYRTGIVQGDSVIGASPVSNPTPTTGTFIFGSPADSNLHRFEVAAIDNNDAVDPNPAAVHFWSLPAPGPIIFFLTTPPNNGFIIRYATERFPGLRFTFGVNDPSTFEWDFSWSVDDTLSWSPWSASNEAFVLGSHLKPIVTGVHRIYIRARNRWGVVSEVQDTTFRVVVPPIDEEGYPKRVLIINNNPTGTGQRGDPNLAQVNTFYRSIMDAAGMAGKYDIWTCGAPPPPFVATNFPLPPADTIAKYTTVLFVFEKPQALFGIDNRRRLDQAKQDSLIRYLNIGGNLIWSGTPNIAVAINPYSNWAEYVFHTISHRLQPVPINAARDFIGVREGLLGYPAVRLDSLKIQADSLGALRNMWVNYPTGFAQSISTFDSQRDSAGFEGQPLGIRYLAPDPNPPERRTFSVVHLALPLFYAEDASAIETLRRALQDVGELPPSQ